MNRGEQQDDPHAAFGNPPHHAVYAVNVHTPRLLVLLNEVNAICRQIFIDGRPLPKDPDRPGTGSTAVWEGDTLVIRTNGRDGLWLDMGGTPMTDAATMTERIRRPTTAVDMRIPVDDPKAYASGRSRCPADHARHRVDRRDVRRAEVVQRMRANACVETALTAFEDHHDASEPNVVPGTFRGRADPHCRA
jgi:hypothetical protein